MLQKTVVLCSIIPGPGTRQGERVLKFQSLQELFQLANPKPAYPGSPILFHGNLSKGSDCAGSSPVQGTCLGLCVLSVTA